MSGRKGRWYLAPMLKTPEFLQNVLPGVLDQALGVSADLDLAPDRFAGFFHAQTNDSETCVGEEGGDLDRRTGSPIR